MVCQATRVLRLRLFAFGATYKSKWLYRMLKRVNPNAVMPGDWPA